VSHSILCADPDDTARTETVATLTDDLADLDVNIDTADTLDAATDTISPEFSVVITEYDFPDGTGLELIETTREICPDATCILYTETEQNQFTTDSVDGTITEYVGKNSAFGDDCLPDLVRNSITVRPQTSYPTPQTEAERMDALRSYSLDDPDLLTSLDRITDLAADHFGVKIASINIIREHSQEFLTCYGLAEDWETIEREDSICTFTILEDANVMTVEDVTEDPRFASRSESLTDMGIRSYMGANLTTPAGLVIGTLCIYDDDVRSFTADDETYLLDLAMTAIDLIHAHAQSTVERDDGAQE